MKFLVYETTNLVNGKRYRGAHVCDHDVCCYFGSGALIKKALVKYGSENFKREILRECSSVEEMFEIERELVTPEWVEDPNTYNLKVGGEGGWDYINKSGARWNEEKRKAWSAEIKKLGYLKPNKPSYGMLGKRQSDASKKKISENNASRLTDEEVAQRIKDLAEVNYPKRGSVKKLSELWNVSHTQVKRFIESHFS